MFRPFVSAVWDLATPDGVPTWALGDEASRPVIQHAIEVGINFFDVANVYSQGTAEETIGKALRDFTRRESIVLATKVFAPMRQGPNAMGLSRKAIMTEIDCSLKRLGTDYVDLYQIHRRDVLTPWEETLEALHDLVKMGKVRYLGASAMKAWEFGKALHLQEQYGWTRFITMQDNYSLLAREEENEMLPLCADEGVETLVFSPLARGRLTRPWGESSARADAEPYAFKLTEATAESDEKIVGVVGEIAKERGVSMAEIATAWVRRNVVAAAPIVAAPIIGALKTKHIDDAIASLSLTLNDEEVERLEANYTPRRDHQNISDPKTLANMAAAVGVRTTA